MIWIAIILVFLYSLVLAFAITFRIDKIEQRLWGLEDKRTEEK